MSLRSASWTSRSSRRVSRSWLRKPSISCFCLSLTQRLVVALADADGAELLLQIAQLAQELLLLGPVLLLGRPPDLGHPRERPAGDLAPAQVEQRLAAGQVVQRVGDEVGIVGERDAASAGRTCPGSRASCGPRGDRCRRRERCSPAPSFPRCSPAPRCHPRACPGRPTSPAPPPVPPSPGSRCRACSRG